MRCGWAVKMEEAEGREEEEGRLPKEEDICTRKAFFGREALIVQCAGGRGRRQGERGARWLRRPARPNPAAHQMKREGGGNAAFPARPLLFPIGIGGSISRELPRYVSDKKT